MKLAHEDSTSLRFKCTCMITRRWWLNLAEELATEAHAGQWQRPCWVLRGLQVTAVISALVGGAGNSDVQHGVIRSWWLMWVEATEPIPGTQNAYEVAGKPSHLRSSELEFINL